MTKIIQFPQRDLSWDSIEKWIMNTCDNAGLSAKMAHDVVQRYKPLHDSLFDLKKNEVSFPEELPLTHELIPRIWRNLAGSLLSTTVNASTPGGVFIASLIRSGESIKLKV